MSVCVITPRETLTDFDARLYIDVVVECCALYFYDESKFVGNLKKF